MILAFSFHKSHAPLPHKKWIFCFSIWFCRHQLKFGFPLHKDLQSHWLNELCFQFYLDFSTWFLPCSNSSGCIFNQANLVIGSFMTVKMRSQLKKVLIFTWYWMFGCEAPLWSTLVILEFSWPSIPGSWFVDNCGHKIRVSIIWKSTASPRMGAPTNRTSVHNGLW